MNRLRLVLRWGVVALVLALLSYGAVGFQVAEYEQAVVTRFGRPVRIIDAAGLQFKWPWPVESVVRLDRRIEVLESRLSEALTADKRNVILPIFVLWRVEDPLRFLQATQGQAEGFRIKLDSMATSARNAALGRFSFGELVSVEPGVVRLAELEESVAAMMREEVRATYGVEIISVGVSQLQLPAANTPFMFDRMRAERAQYAAAFRAEGQRAAEEIRSVTDAEKTGLLAAARAYAEEQKGKAEAEAAAITAAAYAADPELFRFLRELEALRAVAGRNVTLVIGDETPPFNLLSPSASGTGGGVVGTSAAGRD